MTNVLVHEDTQSRSPKRLFLAGKLWSDILSSAEIRIAGRTSRGGRVRADPDPLRVRLQTNTRRNVFVSAVRRNRAQQHLATDVSRAPESG